MGSINSTDEPNVEDVIEEDVDIFPERYSISSYGADYVVDSLVKRIQAGDIYIPKYQREFIWKLKQSSRFIESLLLGLPVPGIFLSKDDDTNKLVVIDGQQRLRSLDFFYKGIFYDKKEFSLINVQKKFEGKTYRHIEPEDRRQLDDSIIHATIIRQDAPVEDNTSVYHIFERLNTSGTPLTHQEIRATIFLGEFNNLLEKLNEFPEWREIFGKKSQRRKDQELILRFFALYYDLANYSPPMRNFLNNFMLKNKNLFDLPKENLIIIFESVVALIAKTIGKNAFRISKAFNAAVFDAIMVGVANRLTSGPIINTSEFSTRYKSLLESKSFRSAIETGTTAKSNSVRIRILEATKTFSNLK